MHKNFLLHITTLFLSFLFLQTLFVVSHGSSVLDLGSLQDTKIDAILRRNCSKKIGECFEEAEMESEISRRVLLMHKKYISYETLKRDMVPCGQPGASYYDCHAGVANPYSRGCEVITRCAREIKH